MIFFNLKNIFFSFKKKNILFKTNEDRAKKLFSFPKVKISYKIYPRRNLNPL